MLGHTVASKISIEIDKNPSQGREYQREEEVDVGGAAELLEEVEREECEDGVLGRVRRVVAELRVDLLRVDAHGGGRDVDLGGSIHT